MVKYWDSIADMVRDTKTTLNHGGTACDWTGYKSHEEIGQLLLIGDDEMVRKCDKLLSKLDNIELPLLPQSEVRRDVFGSRVSIGEYSTGSPTCMRRRIKVQSEVAPLKIMVGISSSACIDADQLQRRGMLMLALLRKIELVRPVDLFVFCELDGREDGDYFPVVKIDSRPLALGVAASAICHTATARHLLYGWGRVRAGYCGRFAKGFKGGKDATYETRRMKVLGCTQDDLIFDSPVEWDNSFDNPEKWLQDQLKRVGILMEG